jgi:hypothetical protein
MTRPSKFALMRANRDKPQTRELRMKRLQARMDELEQDMAAEWNVERRPFAYQRQELAELREIDIDAIHAKQKNTVRRWWWPSWRTA